MCENLDLCTARATALGRTSRFHRCPATGSYRRRGAVRYRKPPCPEVRPLHADGRGCRFAGMAFERFGDG